MKIVRELALEQDPMIPPTEVADPQHGGKLARAVGTVISAEPPDADGHTSATAPLSVRLARLDRAAYREADSTTPEPIASQAPAVTQVVSAAIVRRDVDGRKHMLLGLRGPGSHEGKWCTLGGKANPGEDMIAALARELIEEAGPEARIRVWGVAYEHKGEMTTAARRFRLICYWAGPEDGAEFVARPEEKIVEVRWFTAEEMADLPLAPADDANRAALIRLVGGSALSLPPDAAALIRDVRAMAEMVPTCSVCGGVGFYPAGSKTRCWFCPLRPGEYEAATSEACKWCGVAARLPCVTLGNDSRDVRDYPGAIHPIRRLAAPAPVDVPRLCAALERALAAVRVRDADIMRAYHVLGCDNRVELHAGIAALRDAHAREREGMLGDVANARAETEQARLHLASMRRRLDMLLQEWPAGHPMPRPTDGGLDAAERTLTDRLIDAERAHDASRAEVTRLERELAKARAASQKAEAERDALKDVAFIPLDRDSERARAILLPGGIAQAVKVGLNGFAFQLVGETFLGAAPRNQTRIPIIVRIERKGVLIDVEARYADASKA